ncbi:hypothetical protein [Spiroplasma ixodetis]|uniref:Uncharacterized protein n=1 Tax=Spiroplasma ixodetis TaxID=2141 RepID=A0ABN7BS76_9MOLU
MPWEPIDLSQADKNKSKNKNEAIRIKEKINLSSLTKKQEKKFTKKYGKYDIFNDNSINLTSRIIFFRKMFERQNQKKLKKKYAKIYNLIKKIKNETRYVSTETKEYFQYNLSSLNLKMQKEIDLINNSKDSKRRKQVKISFINKMKSEIDIKTIQKIIEPFKNIKKLEKKVNNYINIFGITSLCVPLVGKVKNITSCLSSVDSIFGDNDWYKEKKQKLEDKLENHNTNSKESLKVDEINKEVQKLFLKSDDKNNILLTKPAILK